MTDNTEAGKEEFESADGPVIICQHPHRPNDEGRGEFDYNRAASVSSMTLSDHGQNFFTNPPRMDTKSKKTLLEQERYAASEGGYSDDEGEDGEGGVEEGNDVQMSQTEKVAMAQEEEALRNRRLWSLKNMMGMKKGGGSGGKPESSNVKGYVTDGDKTRPIENTASAEAAKDDNMKSPFDADSVVQRAMALTNPRPGTNSTAGSTEVTDVHENNAPSPKDKDSANINTTNYDSSSRSLRAAKNRRNRNAAPNTSNSSNSSISSHVRRVKHEHSSVDPDSATITSFSNEREKLPMDDLCRNLEEEVIRLKLELAQAKGLVDEAVMSGKRETEEKFRLAIYSRQLEEEVKDLRTVSESYELENTELKGRVMALVRENEDLKQTLGEGNKSGNSGMRRINSKQMWGNGRM